MKIIRLTVLLLSLLLFAVSIFSNPIKTEASPDGEINSGKKVYLTFDDGPIPVITEQILDVLKKYNVKATFFVVGKEIPGREHILKRIYNEGHSIGLHTYNHKYSKQYYSGDVLIKEMLETREQIYNILGISPSIIRFPGGSMNRLSGELLTKLHNNNMKVFDWNVDMRDGKDSSTPVKKLIKNAETFKPGYTRLIILAHTNSTNMNTVKALPEIIRFYQHLNYEFVPILDDTSEYHFRLKKPAPIKAKPNNAAFVDKYLQIDCDYRCGNFNLNKFNIEN